MTKKGKVITLTKRTVPLQTHKSREGLSLGTHTDIDMHQDVMHEDYERLVQSLGGKVPPVPDKDIIEEDSCE